MTAFWKWKRQIFWWEEFRVLTVYSFERKLERALFDRQMVGFYDSKKGGSIAETDPSCRPSNIGDLKAFAQGPRGPNDRPLILSGFDSKGPTRKLNALSHAREPQSLLCGFLRTDLLQIEALVIILDH